MQTLTDTKNIARILLILTILIIGCFNFWNEKIWEHGGYGWDGNGYADFTIHFSEYIVERKIWAYYMPRILPSAFLHYVFRLFHIPFEKTNIIAGFALLNIACITWIMYYYFRLVQYFRWSFSAELIGFASLFLNFFILKLSMYYPVLTDIPAFAFGMAVFYHYIRGNAIWVAIYLFLGSFIFPSFFFFAPLLIFPLVPFAATPKIASDRYIRIFIVISALIVIDFLYRGGGLKPINNATNIAPAWWRVSWIAVGLYIWVLLDILPSWRTLFLLKKYASLKGTMAAIFTVLTVFCIVYFWGNHGWAPNDSKTFLTSIITESLVMPFNNWVAHSVYYGWFLIIILPMIFFRKTLTNDFLHQFGIGAFIVLFISLCLALLNESRQLINFYPLWIIAGVHFFDKYWKINEKWAWFYVLMSFIAARWYFHINVTDFPYLEEFKPQDYPYQYFFMFMGPWVKYSVYAQHAFAWVIGAICFFVYWKMNKKTSTNL